MWLSRALLRSLSRVGFVCASSALAAGQCLDWSDAFGLPGLDQDAFAATVFDDGLGGGPQLIVGGQFTLAGGVSASGVVRWSGTDWEPLGAGLGGHAWASAWAFARHDDGSGPALFVGGSFGTAGGVPAGNIARWNGAAWSAVGAGFDGQVNSLVVFDDGLGGGPCLYAAGGFSSAGGALARNLARWDGASWSEVGGGVPGATAHLYEVLVFDDGTGPALYVGGEFTQVGTTPASNVARWDGLGWSTLGAGTNGSIRAMVVHDPGTGSELFVGGEFSQAGGVGAKKVARWDGAAWGSLGSGASDTVRALGVHDDGDGEALYVGGQFLEAGGLQANGVARWQPSGWSLLRGGLQGASRIAWAFASLDVGAGAPPQLVVCGSFGGSGATSAPNVAVWNGTRWSGLGAGAGMSATLDEGVRGMAAFDDGTGATLYAGGAFASAGSALTSEPAVARWNGSDWSALPECPWLLGRPTSMAVFDPGTGPGLWVGVTGSGAAMWNGLAWDPSQSIGTHGSWAGVKALATHDDGSGPALYVGGWFTDGCFASLFNLLRWDGSTCSAVGSGVGAVNALLEFDDGSGPLLVAAGQQDYFSPQGFVSIWDGATWSSLGGLPAVPVLALAAYDDGAGPRLYAGGPSGVLRWDGAGWTSIGDGQVNSLGVHDDGTGPALYAGGSFTAMAGVPANSIARWDGMAWSALGLGIETGTYTSVNSLLSFDGGAGARLWAGGSFLVAGGRPSSGIARWGEDCGCSAVVYCTAKTNSQGCVPAMAASGNTSLTSSEPLMLTAAQVLNQKFGLLFYGKTGADVQPFLGGTLCVGSPIRRTPAQFSGGNALPEDCSGAFAIDFKAYALSGVDAGLVPGASVNAQYWYRDPSSSFGSGTSDAVSLQLCP